MSGHDIPTGRVAGIDYGLRRIGVAVCDASRILASPLLVHEPRRDPGAEEAFYRKLASDEQLVGFVVGLPLNADGTASRMSAEAEKFGGWLAAATGLPVAFQDERYTSAEAAGRLAGTGLSRGRKKQVSDAIAAQILLTDWMDRSRSSTR
jgi:putative Holliday junction resolvase